MRRIHGATAGLRMAESLRGPRVFLTAFLRGLVIGQQKLVDRLKILARLPTEARQLFLKVIILW